MSPKDVGRMSFVLHLWAPSEAALRRSLLRLRVLFGVCGCALPPGPRSSSIKLFRPEILSCVDFELKHYKVEVLISGT